MIFVKLIRLTNLTKLIGRNARRDLGVVTSPATTMYHHCSLPQVYLGKLRTTSYSDFISYLIPNMGTNKAQRETEQTPSDPMLPPQLGGNFDVDDSIISCEIVVSRACIKDL